MRLGIAMHDGLVVCIAGDGLRTRRSVAACGVACGRFQQCMCKRVLVHTRWAPALSGCAGSLLVALMYMLLWHPLHGPNVVMIVAFWLQLAYLLAELDAENFLHLDIKLANIAAYEHRVTTTKLDLVDWGSGRTNSGDIVKQRAPQAGEDSSVAFTLLAPDDAVGTEGVGPPACATHHWCAHALSLRCTWLPCAVRLHGVSHLSPDGVISGLRAIRDGHSPAARSSCVKSVI